MNITTKVLSALLLLPMACVDEQDSFADCDPEIEQCETWDTEEEFRSCFPGSCCKFETGLGSVKCTQASGASECPNGHYWKSCDEGTCADPDCDHSFGGDFQNECCS